MSTESYQIFDEDHFAVTSIAYRIAILENYNLGHKTILASLPMLDFLRMSVVANIKGLEGKYKNEMVAQRELNQAHASRLALYLIKGMVNSLIERNERHQVPVSHALIKIRESLGISPYFSLQPIVANLRTLQNQKGQQVKVTVKQTPEEQEFALLRFEDVLFVVDGQHRRHAIESVEKFLLEIDRHEKLPSRSFFPASEEKMLTPADIEAWREVLEFMRKYCRLAVEIHIGLNGEKERQLFDDLNSHGKKTPEKLSYEFDKSNLLKDFIRGELKQILTITHRSEADLGKINAILWLNEKNIRGGITPRLYKERHDLAVRFWETLEMLEGFRTPNMDTLSDMAMLKALAKLTHDLAWDRKKGSESEAIEFLRNLKNMDFGYENPIWRYYEFNVAQHRKYDMATAGAWLPKPPRVVGRWDESTRTYYFDPKHNDIYMILGDMIRFKMGLPKRLGSLTD